MANRPFKALRDAVRPFLEHPQGITARVAGNVLEALTAAEVLTVKQHVSREAWTHGAREHALTALHRNAGLELAERRAVPLEWPDEVRTYYRWTRYNADASWPGTLVRECDDWHVVELRLDIPLAKASA